MTSTAIALAKTGTQANWKPDTLPVLYKIPDDILNMSGSESNNAKTYKNATLSPKKKSLAQSFSDISWHRLPGEYELLQLWEGCVLCVYEERFKAKIIDKTDKETPDEEVIIPIQEIDSDDLRLLKPGAIFYWSMRYAKRPGDGKRRESVIRFRRLINLSQTQLKTAKEEALRLEKLLNPNK
jgi:hypothetical protein